MTDTTPLFSPAQLAAELAELRQWHRQQQTDDAAAVLAELADPRTEVDADRKPPIPQAQMIAARRAELANAIAKALDASDSDALSDAIYEARNAMGHFCDCGSELDEPRIGGYCSRNCWLRDGGDL